MKLIKGITLLSASMMLAACGSSSDSDPIATPAYSFESVVNGSTESSVSYFGQATRHALITELKALIGSEELYEVSQNDAGQAAVIAKLKSVYAAGTIDNSDSGKNLVEENLYTGADATPTGSSISLKSTGTSLLQFDFSLMSSGKNLMAKMAGQDNALTQPFFGWTTPATIDMGKDTEVDNIQDVPHSLVLEWFGEIAKLATDNDGTTTFVDPVTGRDYQQLIQKFVLGALAYSQGAEDYLKAGKGLTSDNSQGKDGGVYSALEHSWDEGFGYFGAGRDYVNRTDSDNKSIPDFDQNQDGQIDIKAEYNFGHSINAVKRDLGASEASPVDFSATAFNAFKAGRQIIQDNYGTNPVEGTGYHVELEAQADIALANWEKAIAATVIHYINEVIVDTQSLGSNDEASVEDRAKHWSEMKGFALSLQFSPKSSIDMDDLLTVLNNMREGPALIDGSDADSFITDLLAARTLVQNAYGFLLVNTVFW
jgi:hypothetical protein